MLGHRLGSGPLNISLIFLEPEGAQDSSPHGGGPDKKPSQTTGARLKSLLGSCPLMYSIGQSKSYAKSDTSEWGTYTLIPPVGGTVEQHGRLDAFQGGGGRIGLIQSYH